MSLLRCALVALLFFSSANAQTILGFTPASAAREHEIETKFKAIPNADEERRQHRIFTQEPHLAGSKRNNELAHYIRDEWKKQGLEDVVIRRYDVYGTNPKSASLEMVAPVHYQALLRETPLDADPDTKNPAISGAWMGMSISGEVTAPVVYAHSGNPEDYDLLRKNGISVKGKIVLVRYSNPYSYRGFKALTAQREGAAAILIYSDPAEDGYKKGQGFSRRPLGPGKPHSARRDHLRLHGAGRSAHAGMGVGARRQAHSASRKQSRSRRSWRCRFPGTMPSLCSKTWTARSRPRLGKADLPFQYHLGGERVQVHLKIEMDNATQPYYVVEGRIRGSELPDEWVVLGNHRDAWVFGGVDPSSGTASMMELTRALGQLQKQGIRPRRTLVICSWDGEEVGLTGSTEWGEQFADELAQESRRLHQRRFGDLGPELRGRLSPLSRRCWSRPATALQDPSGKTLYDAWKATSSAKEQKASNRAR